MCVCAWCGVVCGVVCCDVCVCGGGGDECVCVSACACACVCVRVGACAWERTRRRWMEPPAAAVLSWSCCPSCAAAACPKRNGMLPRHETVARRKGNARVRQ